MSRPSARHQIKLAFAAITRFGTSRHADKAIGEAGEWIYSHGSYKVYFDKCSAFVRWAFSEYNVNLLTELRPPMVERYISDMRERQLSSSTIKCTLSALRKLDSAIEARWHVRLDLVPNGLKGSRRTPRFGYPQSLAQEMIEWLQPRQPTIAVLAEIMCEAGLRIDEAVHLRWDKIDMEKGTVEVKGKGGAVRTVALLNSGVLTRLPNRGRLWVFSPSRADIRLAQHWIAQAAHSLGWEGEAGAHRLRATFAERFLGTQMAEGKTEREARVELSRALGHRRVDVTYHYVPEG